MRLERERKPRSASRLRSWNSSKIARTTRHPAPDPTADAASATLRSAPRSASMARPALHAGYGNRPSADRLAQRLGHPRGRRASGDPARLQHQDLRAPSHGSSSSAKGNARRLAGPRRPLRGRPTARRRARRAGRAGASSMGRRLHRACIARIRAGSEGGITIRPWARRPSALGSARTRPARPARAFREIDMRGLMQDWPLLVHKIWTMPPSISASAKSSPARSSGTAASPHHLRGHPCPRAEARQGARQARREARRPHRHARLELGPASRGLVRHHGRRRRLSHAEPAPVPRADRLYRETTPRIG